MALPSFKVINYIFALERRHPQSGEFFQLRKSSGEDPHPNSKVLTRDNSKSFSFKLDGGFEKYSKEALKS